MIDEMGFCVGRCRDVACGTDVACSRDVACGRDVACYVSTVVSIRQ